MPQFPQWKLDMAAWTDAAHLRQAQLSQAVSDLVARAREVTDAIPVTAASLFEQARTRGAQLQAEVIEDIRARVNLLDLATKHDVEVQSKLGRSRVSFVLKEFLETQRGHEEALLTTIRTELREELQAFAAAVDDDLFAVDDQPATGAPRTSRQPPDELDYLVDDDLDLVGNEAALPGDVLDPADD